MRFFEVVVALAIREFEHRRSKLTSWERRKINSRTRMYFFMKGSRVVLRGVRLRDEPLTHCVFWNSLGNEIWSIYNAKYSEMWTFYTPCVFVAVSGDFCHETARQCRVTLSAGVTICHVNVSRWGNPPGRDRGYGKKFKSETRMFWNFVHFLTVSWQKSRETVTDTQGV